MLRIAALVALLLIAPAAAQPVPGPAFRIAIDGLPDSVMPATTNPFNLTLERVCPNQAMVLTEQSVQIEFRSAGEIQVGGPMTAHFPQTNCALPEGQELRGEYKVAVDRHAEYGRAFLVKIEAYPEYTNPASSSGEPVSMDFIVQVGQEPKMEPVEAVAVDGEENVPSPAFALVGLALLASAFAMRHRRS